MSATETIYRCTECGEGDRDRGTSGPAPMHLICWNCRAGREATTLSMAMELRKGMYPVKDGMYPWGEPVA